MSFEFHKDYVDLAQWRIAGGEWISSIDMEMPGVRFF